MHRIHLTIIATFIAVCLSVPVAAHATDVQSLTQKAQQAASAGKTTQALGLYELAMTQSADQPDSMFGPLDGQYWQLISQSGDFPRALDFFTALASGQSSPGASLLASKASAIGGYLGWLHQNNLISSVPEATLRQIDLNARSTYKKALAIDPDNFAALYGFAIYESYSPNGKEHMQQLLAKLNSLRASHPQYPWQIVDYLEQHGHPQQ